MFTTVAFSKSQDAASVFTTLTAVPDQHITAISDVIYVPEFANQIVGVYLAGRATAKNAYFDAPSLRRVNKLYICPIQTAIIPSGDESFFMRMLSPLPLEVGEGIKVYENSATAAAAIVTCGLWLADKPLVPVSGEIFTVLATAAITVVASNWANGALTFADVLPVGTYAIVGAHCVHTNGVLFRFVPVGSMNRPGGLSSANIGASGLASQRYGGMGQWCTFHTTTPPSLDVLGVAAGAVQTLHIDLMKVR